jgi:CBS-domain-containing membrane protein
VPKAADTALACIGAASGTYALGVLESTTGLPFYAPPLAAGAIIIFSGMKPPPAKNVFGGMLGAAAFALALEAVGGGTEETRALAVAGSLLWFKSSGALFPPAAAAAAVFLDSAELQSLGWTYLAFPCLSGVSVLYGLALGLSRVRQDVRVRITRSQLEFSADTLGDMREVFDRFDTSGDGRIDAMELQVMLRALLSTEMDLEDCEDLINRTDVNGDGSIDFEEFVMMMKFDAKLTGQASSLSS